MFPYDAAAVATQPFSAAWVPGPQGAGRFDIPDLTPVWYCAESPAHAVAEVVQGLRNQPLEAADLTRFGFPLALVAMTLVVTPASSRAVRTRGTVLDLCDPAVLDRYGIRPDALASWDFAQTQRIARHLFTADCLGFRWWSALTGDWHTTVLFHAKLSRATLRFGPPDPLTLGTAAVIEAARRLAITLPSS